MVHKIHKQMIGTDLLTVYALCSIYNEIGSTLSPTLDYEGSRLNSHILREGGRD